jgi:hypothetical protein
MAESGSLLKAACAQSTDGAGVVTIAVGVSRVNYRGA